jgi:hypothetical protein
MSVISKLAELHELDIARWFGGRKSKSSGNQFNDQADGRHNRYHRAIAFAWDCKAAMPGTKSISITRSMLAKLEEQAHAEQPLLPIRFYATERGQVEYDYTLIRTQDLRALLEES